MHGADRFATIRCSRPSRAEAPCVSDIEPSEVVVPGKRIPSEPFGPELTETPVPTPVPARSEREGLPSSYRMRADPHYVDQLTARRADWAERERGEAARALQPAAEVTDPGAAAEGLERRGDRILVQLTEELATLASASAMLTNASPLARRLGADLVLAETWRATWLVKAHALADGRERAHLRSRALGPILEQVRQGLTPECRLAGVSLHVAANDWNAAVNVDESILLAGITGAVIATLGVIGLEEGATVRVSVDATGGELRSVEVAQDDVPAMATSSVRFFDVNWSGRPGGWMAGLGAVTARAAAQLLGGSAALLVADRRGTSIRLSLAKLH